MEEKNKHTQYNIKDITHIFTKIENILGGAGIIDYIAVTPNEFSIYIQNGISMILTTELDKLKNVVHPDTIFFNENNPQLIVANTMMSQDNISDNDMKNVMSFVNAVAEFICPCTGSEMHIHKNEIKIFIDQQVLTHNEYIGVYHLIDETNLVRIVLDIQRPYISIIYTEGALNE